VPTSSSDDANRARQLTNAGSESRGIDEATLARQRWQVEIEHLRQASMAKHAVEAAARQAPGTPAGSVEELNPGKKVSNIVWIGVGVVVIAAIAIAVSLGGSASKSASYEYGYNEWIGLNIGVKNELIMQGATGQIYCSSMQQAMHSELSGNDAADYIRGCVDAWNAV